MHGRVGGDSCAVRPRGRTVNVLVLHILVRRAPVCASSVLALVRHDRRGDLLLQSVARASWERREVALLESGLVIERCQLSLKLESERCSPSIALLSELGVDVCNLLQKK